MNEQEDVGVTFSDEGFERRYSSEDQTEAVPRSRTAPAAKGSAPTFVRSRNRFMRTLLRRRLAASGRI
jgi:hypothetical protein